MFKTDRLVIRELKNDDLEHIHLLHSLPETDEYNTLGIPETIGTTKGILAEWIVSQKLPARNSFTFAIDRIDDGNFLGLIGLNLGKANYKTAEVWFKLHKDYWKRGYIN